MREKGGGKSEERREEGRPGMGGRRIIGEAYV